MNEDAAEIEDEDEDCSVCSQEAELIHVAVEVSDDSTVRVQSEHDEGEEEDDEEESDSNDSDETDSDADYSVPEYTKWLSVRYSVEEEVPNKCNAVLKLRDILYAMQAINGKIVWLHAKISQFNSSATNPTCALTFNKRLCQSQYHYLFEKNSFNKVQLSSDNYKKTWIIVSFK